MSKKQQQLGESPSTAHGRLVRDLLFSYVDRDGILCFRCGKPLTRESFSIDHIDPWLDSATPKELFFDLTNVAYSHLSCNTSAARRPNQKYFTAEDRVEATKRLRAESMRRTYTTEKRRAKKAATGH